VPLQAVLIEGMAEAVFAHQAEPTRGDQVPALSARRLVERLAGARAWAESERVRARRP